MEMSQEQAEQLSREASAEKRVRRWRRYRGVQLVGEGLRPVEVAALLGCSRASVYGWVARWRDGGVEGLREGRHKGRERSLDEGAEALLSELLESDPQQHGYHSTGWTVAMLRVELESAGYRVGERTIRRALHRMGWSWKRPKYVLGRPDPEHTTKKPGSGAGARGAHRGRAGVLR